MAEILLCNQPISSNSLENQCGVAPSDIMGYGCSANPTSLQPYRPYLIGLNPSILDQNLLGQLSSGPIAQNLTDLSLSFGEDNTLALADISAKLKDYNIAMTGASTSMYANRVQGFGLAVKKYQEALLAYRDAVKTSPAARTLAKQKAVSAFNEMQSRFKHELAAVTAASKARKGTPLGNPTRATNIARSSRNVVKLNVTSQVQASNLVKYGKYAKALGNGLAIIDFGTRVGNIQNSYKAGGKWERDLFIESSSFALSTIAGSAAVNVGSAALGLLMVATPIGWVGLIVGGLTVAGLAAGATVITNNAIKNNSGDVYDEIMAWLNY